MNAVRLESLWFCLFSLFCVETHACLNKEYTINKHFRAYRSINISLYHEDVKKSYQNFFILIVMSFESTLSTLPSRWFVTSLTLTFFCVSKKNSIMSQNIQFKKKKTDLAYCCPSGTHCTNGAKKTSKMDAPKNLLAVLSSPVTTTAHTALMTLSGISHQKTLSLWWMVLKQPFWSITGEIVSSTDQLTYRKLITMTAVVFFLSAIKSCV